MQIYQRAFLDSTNTALTVDAGESSQLFPIGFPPNGYLTKFTVRQVATDGTLCDWKARIYDRDYTDPVVPAALAMIVDELSGVAGDDDGWAGYQGYQNNEGTVSVPSRYVYVEIELTDGDIAEDTHWEVILSCEVGGFAG